MNWQIFLTVLASLFAFRLYENYQSARQRNRTYCRKEIRQYELMMRISQVCGRDTKMDAQQHAHWIKEAKSFIPIHPTEAEQETEFDETQDERIRHLLRTLDHWLNEKPESQEESKP